MATSPIEEHLARLSLSSKFDLRCHRCGSIGYHNNRDNIALYGATIQCQLCGQWEHIACQRYGRASLTSNARFTCDHCDMSHCFPRFKEAERLRRTAESRREHKLTGLTERLKPGRGGLARHGEYFYPVRLIQKTSTKGWVVCWWRGNIFPSVSPPPKKISFVLTQDLIDSLWRDSVRRRKVRLGMWTHPSDEIKVEDILSDPSSVPYTQIVDTALAPHKDVFRKLVAHDYDSLDSPVPAMSWIDQRKGAHRTHSTAIFPYVGELSVVERAQLANWFDIHITNQDPELRLNWLGRLPFAHAITVYIAHRLKSQISPSNDHRPDLLSRAWDLQLSGLSRTFLDVDVDSECLYILEADMFEVSAGASIAGYYQWGLDAGHHQDNWYPYGGLPEEYHVDNYDFDESHLETGPDYIQYAACVLMPPDEPTAAAMKPRPKPRRKVPS